MSASSATRGTGSEPFSIKGRIGEAAAWSIAIIAWGISLASQVGLALAHGFHGPRDIEALGDGLLPDLASLSMMLLALDQAERGRSARLTWGLSILAGVFMEWANIAYAWGDPEAVILHAWPPFLVVVTLYVLVHTRRQNASAYRTEPPNRTRTVRNQVLIGSPEPPALPIGRRLAEATWREALAIHGVNASNDVLAEQLGCSADSIRRYRRRWPATEPRILEEA